MWGVLTFGGGVWGSVLYTRTSGLGLCVALRYLCGLCGFRGLVWSCESCVACIAFPFLFGWGVAAHPQGHALERRLGHAASWVHVVRFAGLARCSLQTDCWAGAEHCARGWLRARRRRAPARAGAVDVGDDGQHGRRGGAEEEAAEGPAVRRQ
eukprot:341086-Prymnesium_polylepis.1